MVQKHIEKLQAEKEAAALEQLSALMPGVGPQVRVLALKEAQFSVDAAVNLLRAFQTQNDEQLKAIQKRRKKIKEAEAEAVAKAEAEAEESSSSSSSDDSSSSDSSDDSGSDSDSDGGKGKRKRGSSKKSSKKSKKKRKRSKKDKKDSRDKKKRKKDKGKDKAAPKTLTNSDNFGKFGIIRETDAAAKRSEFTLWALEVKKVDVETLQRTEEKELFKDYIEDYNTGTMPHRKYYNLELYERQKAAKAAAKGMAKAEKKEKSGALADEEALRKQREEERQKLAQERLQQAYEELQAHGDKAKDMREQEMLRLQMQVAYKTGDAKKAQKLLERLMPDEEKKAKGIIK